MMTEGTRPSLKLLCQLIFSHCNETNWLVDNHLVHFWIIIGIRLLPTILVAIGFLPNQRGTHSPLLFQYVIVLFPLLFQQRPVERIIKPCDK